MKQKRLNKELEFYQQKTLEFYNEMEKWKKIKSKGFNEQQRHEILEMLKIEEPHNF